MATPLGHLGDLSERMREALAQCDRVLCEDTRRTSHILAHLGLKKSLHRLDAHTEERQVPGLISDLQSGAHFVLVSDAGAPGISDPGRKLVAAAVEAMVPVEPIPGPSAVTTALMVSGFPADTFVFLGFLPRRPGRLRRALASAEPERTLVFFESPYRVKKTLASALEVLGDAPVVVAREMTKKYEEFLRGTLKSVMTQLEGRPELKGEITVVIAPRETLVEEEE